jgi:hypothetical protein
MSEVNGIRPEVELLITSMAELSKAAQEARKWLLVEKLDEMPEHLLELEKHSRNARTAISSIQQLSGRR